MPVLDLGTQAIATHFPKYTEPSNYPTAPLKLMRCSWCDLGQLSHTVDRHHLFSGEYGYRSGMTQTMCDHLLQIANSVPCKPGDIVVDIGCNDGTLLSFFPDDIRKVGFEPSNACPKTKDFHHEFFSLWSFQQIHPNAKARAVFSLAMFYDLDRPIDFAAQVHKVLADDGVWVIEVQDMGSLGPIGAYDGICHEHLTYWDIQKLTEFLMRNGFTIESASLSYINGGSLLVYATKSWSIDNHQSYPTPWSEFGFRAEKAKYDLLGTIRKMLWEGANIWGYGASTKGNVILQFCELTRKEIVAIADKNPEKHTRVTPGTGIPIVSEEIMRAAKPDYLLALPWAFIGEFREREPWAKFIVPFPEVKILQPLESNIGQSQAVRQSR